MQDTNSAHAWISVSEEGCSCTHSESLHERNGFQIWSGMEHIIITILNLCIVWYFHGRFHWESFFTTKISLTKWIRLWRSCMSMSPHLQQRALTLFQRGSKSPLTTPNSMKSCLVETSWLLQGHEELKHCALLMTAISRLDGVVPVVEDWHARMTLMKVFIMQYSYSLLTRTIA